MIVATDVDPLLVTVVHVSADTPHVFANTQGCDGRLVQAPPCGASKFDTFFWGCSRLALSGDFGLSGFSGPQLIAFS